MLERKCSSIFNGVFPDPYLIERILLAIYVIIFFIGLIGNIMTIIIIKYNRHLRTPTNFYLLNLSVSDLMILMCNLPLEMIEIHYGQWPLHIIFCKLRNISAEFFTCSSILTILAFTCERYFAIVHPIHFHQLSHFRRAQKVILIIWFISLIFSVPFGFTYEISSNTILSPTNSTGILIFEEIQCRSCVPKRNIEQFLSIIMIITSLFFFYIPMFIIGTIYLYIGKALRQANKYDHTSDHELSFMSLSSYTNISKKIVNPSPSHSSLFNRDNNDLKQSNKTIGSYSWLKTRARCQARKVVVKTLVAVVIAFFVCYAPLYLQRFLSAIMVLNSKLTAESYLFSKIMAYLYVISGTTFYFGSVINPILYNVVSNKYRRAFRDLFCCRLTYQTKIPMQNQRKLYQIDRTSHQPVRYFIPKTTQQQQQQQEERIDLNPKFLRNKTNEINRFKVNQYLRTPSSSRSNLSSMGSQLSLPMVVRKRKQKRFSLRNQLFRKQTNDTVPWLSTKSRA